MTRLVILIASLLLSTISSPVENTTPRATSDDLVHVIHASENIYQIFRTLDPSWQSGLGCFQNKGLEFFKTTFCDKAKIKESHPIGSLRRAMDDLINPIKERIQKKENLDATDNEFLKWLGVEVANCQREESDPYHANKKLRGSIINSKNLSEKFRALAGREIPVSDGTDRKSTRLNSSH